jgi:hypothetical protein
MNNRTPYFYIIRHISSGKMYAGSRWGKNCHPNDLLKTYITHSNKIKNIISKEGLDSFEVLRIDSYCDGLHPYDYEKSFLEINNCAESDTWINGHNNHLFVYGTKEYKNFMIRKYGVDNPNKLFSTRQKIKTTRKSRNTEYQEKRKQTSLIKYGAEHHMKSESFRTKFADNMLDKTGYTNPSYNPEIKKKISAANKGKILLFNIFTNEKILVHKDSDQYKNLDLSVWKNRNANTKWVNCPITKHKKMIKDFELDYYLSIGYWIGTGSFSEEHRKKISNSHKKRLRK